MNRDCILSHLYLRAVLPAMEDLLRFSTEAREWTREWKCTIKMSVWGGARGALKFREGTAQSRINASSDIHLVFFTPAQLNSAFENKKSLPPIPWGNPFYWKKLCVFQKLTELLQSYLKPSASALRENAFLRAHAVMLLHVLMRAVAIVGELDPPDVLIPTGLAVVEIADIESACWIRVQEGQFFFGLGVPSAEADVTISFASPEIFLEAAGKQCDSHAALGLGQIKVSGLIPFADALGLVMDKVGEYLV
ncbi:MAG: hypothetical protein ACOY3I_02060 [Verrucomicrobiota bacterium]